MKNLGRKAIAGWVKFTLTLGLLVFLPGWTLNYWQGWVYIFLFSSWAAYIGIYLWKNDKKLLEGRLSVGPLAEKEKSQKMIMFFSSLLFVAILVFPSFDYHLGWSHVPFYLNIIGMVLFNLGFGLMFACFRVNTFTSGTIKKHDNQTVISTGPYALVRHPMYTGGLILLLGTPLILGSFWGLLLMIPITFLIILRLLHEEKFLLKDLPGYGLYCQKNKYRLIPFIW